MKPLRLRDTALAALDGVCSRLRCCTPLPLCDTLFQRLALLSDTSLVQSAFGRAFSLRSPLRAGELLSSPSFPKSGALALFACGFSGFVASMLTRFALSLRSSAGFAGNRFRQHSVPVGGSEQESAASRCETAAFVATHSFNGWRCCPIPPFAQTSFGKSFAYSLHSFAAGNHRCLVGLTLVDALCTAPLRLSRFRLRSLRVSLGSLDALQPLSACSLRSHTLLRRLPR